MVLKARVDSDVAAWLDEKKMYGEKSNVTSKALDFLFEYYFCRHHFLKKLIKEHFIEIRQLVRKVGREKKKYG